MGTARPTGAKGQPGRQGGRRLVHPRCGIIDAIRYLAHNGGVWRALSADFPPGQTVYDYHARWTGDGTVNRVHNAVRDQVGTTEGDGRDLAAAIIDSQSVRSAETVTATGRRYDAGKKTSDAELLSSSGR
ncbi:transposase [Polymorphospora lycopeni]|uniref:Transposase n=1 Tax=Polymorphospora lycopeni TaxID=3140240 RepID=A0ABV5D2I6_9ACTN